MTLDFKMRRGTKLKTLVDGKDVDGGIIYRGEIIYVDDLNIRLVSDLTHSPIDEYFFILVYGFTESSGKFIEWVLDDSLFEIVE